MLATTMYAIPIFISCLVEKNLKFEYYEFVIIRWLIITWIKPKHLLQGKPPWHQSLGRSPTRSPCWQRTTQCRLHCHSTQRWVRADRAQTSAPSWWGIADWMLATLRSWSGQGAARSTASRMGTDGATPTVGGCGCGYGHGRVWRLKIRRGTLGHDGRRWV